MDWLEVALAGDAAQDNASPWVLRLTLSHDVKNAKEISFAEIKKMVGGCLCVQGGVRYVFTFCARMCAGRGGVG